MVGLQLDEERLAEQSIRGSGNSTVRILLGKMYEDLSTSAVVNTFWFVSFG